MQDAFALIATNLPSLIGGGLSVGAGGIAALKFFQWAAGFAAGRVDKRTENIDKRAATVDDAMNQIIGTMRDEIRRLSERVEVLEEASHGDKDQIDKLKAENMLLKARDQGYGEAKNRVQTELAAVALVAKAAGQ